MNGKAQEFGFDWILNETDSHKVELINFYKEGQWEIVFIKVENRNSMTGEWDTHYEAGNPLLGGVRAYASYKSAEKKFYDLVGRVHIDAQAKEAA